MGSSQRFVFMSAGHIMFGLAMGELHNFDVIPDPKVVEAALRACRRVNDYALTIRFLESLKIKCGTKKNRELVYPWIMQQVTFARCFTLSLLNLDQANSRRTRHLHHRGIGSGKARTLHSTARILVGKIVASYLAISKSIRTLHPHLNAAVKLVEYNSVSFQV